MTPLKKQKRKTRTGRRAQAKKRGLDRIEAEGRELGHEFKNEPPLIGKVKP